MHWDKRFLQLAKLVSSWSKDPSTQTGAVIVDDKRRIVSLGFNSFPRRIADDVRLDDRALKYECIVHCEINALVFAQQSVAGCTLYTYPFVSCSRCAVVMIQAGITRVVFPPTPPEAQRWRENFDLARGLFTEAGVIVEEVPW